MRTVLILCVAFVLVHCSSTTTTASQARPASQAQGSVDGGTLDGASTQAPGSTDGGIVDGSSPETSASTDTFDEDSGIGCHPVTIQRCPVPSDGGAVCGNSCPATQYGLVCTGAAQPTDPNCTNLGTPGQLFSHPYCCPSR